MTYFPEPYHVGEKLSNLCLINGCNKRSVKSGYWSAVWKVGGKEQWGIVIEERIFFCWGFIYFNQELSGSFHILITYYKVLWNWILEIMMFWIIFNVFSKKLNILHLLKCCHWEGRHFCSSYFPREECHLEIFWSRQKMKEAIRKKGRPGKDKALIMQTFA